MAFLVFLQRRFPGEKPEQSYHVGRKSTHFRCRPGSFAVDHPGGCRVGKVSYHVFPLPAYGPLPDILVPMDEVGRVMLPQGKINDVCFSLAGDHLFVVSGSNFEPGTPQGTNNVILQVDAANLAVTKTYEPTFSVLDNGGELVYAFQQVRYVFTDPLGTNLYAIRRIAPDFGVEDWSVEVFEVNP